MIQHKLRILAIGHSYVVALNRSILREVANDPAFEITVAAPEVFLSELGSIECQPEPEGSRLKLIPVKTWLKRWVYTFAYQPKALDQLVGQNGLDLVYAWEEPYVYAGYQIARTVIRLAPDTAYCFRTAQSLPKRYPPPFNWFEQACLRRADGWISDARLVYENCIKRGYPPDRGVEMSLAVDTLAFRPLEEDRRESIRARLGLMSPVLGFLGRLTSAKGVAIMLKAIELLEPNRPWSLLILGTGPEERAIRSWAERRGWTNRVCIQLVEHRQVPDYLPVMDLLIAPSLTTRGWREQFGRMVIEAFACGVPVISSDSGELPWLVGDTGWVVPEAHPQALAGAIREALDSPEKRAAIARAGLQRAQTYSARALGLIIRDYYRSLVEKKHKSARAA